MAAQLLCPLGEFGIISIQEFRQVTMLSKRCIYCSPDRPAKAPFTRDHVIPEAFGKFRDNLVLNEGVCRECNQFFGDNLELLLGRGSAEGVLRLDYQIKPPESAGKLKKDRVRFSLLSTEDNLDGLILEYGEENGEIVVLLVRQVGFPRRNGSGWIYVTESELNDLSKPLPKEIDTDGLVRLVFDSDETKNRLIQVLANRNINCPETIEEHVVPIQKGQEVWVKVQATIDNMVLRCVAKMALNYLAKTAGIDFVVKEDLDPIRSYIRYGTNPGYEIVRVSQHPILTYDNAVLHQTKGHLITVDWSLDKRHIIGQVSLFNFATYHVMLSRNHSGVWRPIKSGHHFNIKSGKVEPLLGVSRYLP
jgi:hypothetical protein